MVRINYFSDLHLEFGEMDTPKVDADIIVAAGDIGISTQGVDWLNLIDKPVVYIAGNHEYYGGEFKQTQNALRSKCAGSNVHFLENNSFIYKNVRFLGCTLWTDLFIEGDEKAAGLSKTLNDFRKINYAEDAFNIQQFSQLYRKSKQWLEKELAKPFAGRTIIVTHHAPSQWSWNDSPNALKKLAYCNDLKELLHQYDVAAWFHGHVHSLGDYRIAGARILCNPRGYVGRKLVDKFNLNKIVRI